MKSVGLKRKIIDLPEDVFQSLSVAAAVNGKNLKNFIEEVLTNFAKDKTDEAVYSYMMKNDPEGDIYLNSDEKSEFEEFLGL